MPSPAINVLEAQSDALDRSDARLEALGYRPEFRREMNLFAVVGMSFTAIGILTGMSSAFQTGSVRSSCFLLRYAWPRFVRPIRPWADWWVHFSHPRIRVADGFTQFDKYYWVSKMKGDKPILGYVTGVLYACAMIFTGTSGNLSTALYIASMAEVGTGITLTRGKAIYFLFGTEMSPDFLFQVQIAAMAWGVNLLSVWWTLIGTVILVVTLLVKSPVKNSASFVFTDLENFTGWENKGFVVLLGFLQAVYTLEGAETSAQVAEEARNAEWLAPIGIAASIVGSWFIGLIYLLALLFSIQSIPSVQSTSFAIPIAQLYYDAVGSRLTLLCLFVVGSCQFMAACTCFTASSRLLYALARDNAIPCKRAFMTLNRFQIAIIISAAYIGSVVAFNAILSSAAIAVMLSYLQPILCRVLWPESMEVRGPFHLGKYSRIVNIISALFTVFVCILFILPTSMPVNALNMNYSVVAIGAVLILILGSWMLYGRYHFKGPVSTVDMPPLTEDVDEDKKIPNSPCSARKVDAAALACEVCKRSAARLYPSLRMQSYDVHLWSQRCRICRYVDMSALSGVRCKKNCVRKEGAWHMQKAKDDGRHPEATLVGAQVTPWGSQGQPVTKQDPSLPHWRLGTTQVLDKRAKEGWKQPRIVIYFTSSLGVSSYAGWNRYPGSIINGSSRVVQVTRIQWLVSSQLTPSLSLALPESYQTTLFNWLWRRFASLFSHSRLIETPKLNTSERSSLSEIMAVPDKSTNATFANQSSLPKLPIPPLKDTCERYLRALSALQDEREHHATKLAVEDFLARSGPMWDAKLREYAETKDRYEARKCRTSGMTDIQYAISYIEEFWYESYLSHSDPVVLALNPFFVLEDDPNPARGAQLQRAASLITASLGFVHDLRAGILEPDAVRTTKLDMDQYTRLFGTSRIPTQHGCRMSVTPNSRHIVVLRRGQIYHFDCLDSKNRPIVTEQDILRNLKAIVADADQTPVHEAAKSSVGLLTTENRKIWSQLRQTIHNSSPSNASSLEVIDEALFIVCLDDAAPEDLGELCGNFLCGTYGLSGGVQVGTCTNRWYDKLQIIVCANGAAGINFEHTGVDGHTVLRYAADIFTEGLMLLARSINPKAPVMFKAKLSPHAKASKVKPGPDDVEPEPLDPSPKKLEWELSNTLLTGIRFAETRLSDLICQNDCQALEFTGYGANFIKTHGFSPDAFVQMAFQAAYFGLYGRTECTYEPAMTKAFLHGRTEAIRTVQPSSVNFTRTYFSEAPNKEKIQALRNACVAHSKLTKECSQGLGQDRHLYALYCLVRRELNSAPSSPVSDSGSNKSNQVEMPSIFSDPGWSLLNTSILSTSNCGNPALRLFGFGPVAAEGFGIGYIIKEDGISVCATSKHLQTRRYLDTLSSYLLDVQQLILQIHRAANERAGNFVDHSGVLREAKTGRVIAHLSAQTPAQTPGLGTLELEEEPSTSGYSFFDSVEVQRLARRRPRNTAVGKVLQISEY
ncbi:carnitine choline acetyltransferase family [Rhizoctonia solani]|uniref:Carnitine choline acetyltransferase family n=1 Tax=Rhizoctonia solani TaxID=456999 RepID=A0A8H7IEG3_9AGAM|nr:carnitine choline acetyltransferase family [Rhizoctonia solani]